LPKHIGANGHCWVSAVCSRWPAHLPPKGAVEEGLEEVFDLALGFALPGAQSLEFMDGAPFVESCLKHE